MTDLVVVGKTISLGPRHGETSKSREESEGLTEQGLCEQQMEERMDKFISVGVCAMDSKVGIRCIALGVLLLQYLLEHSQTEVLCIQWKCLLRFVGWSVQLECPAHSNHVQILPYSFTFSR